MPSVEDFIPLSLNIGVKIPSRNPELEGLAIGAGGQRMGFTPPRVRSRQVWGSLYLHESDHTECKAVCIFNSEYWSEKIESKSNCL